MRANKRMLTLMKRASIQWPVAPAAFEGERPRLERIDDSFLLKSEYERNKHSKVADFPDITGFECFINHIHFTYSGTRESLVSCLGYAAAVQVVLARVAQDRQFRVIVGIRDDDCSVRFHQIRPGENWIAEDLEGYKSEAILVFDVPI